jgi:alkylation response protein AidB-like acyl-CoA dehydrogenase
MTELPQPSEYIPEALAASIRSPASEAELLGTLHPDQLSIIYAQNWFNLFVPTEMGGLALSLPEALALEEAIAWVDGSTGWTVTLCSGADWFVGFLPRDTSAFIFGNPKACLAGSGRPSGVAKINGEGYEVSGRWHYATGAPHATAFTANCVVEEEGVTLLNIDGSPVVRSFLFLRDEVIIHNHWHTTGMVATASYTFEVNGLHVQRNRCFIIEPGQAVLHHPIYQYPFLQFAEATLSVNMAGMAARFIQLAEGVFAARNQQRNFSAEQLQAFAQTINSAKSQMKEARQQFYAAVQLSWNTCASGAVVDGLVLNSVSVCCRQLTGTSLQAVDMIYPFCGLAAADKHTEINRVWRNLHTASQHTLLLPV